jgi:hypothetical protein
VVPVEQIIVVKLILAGHDHRRRRVPRGKPIEDVVAAHRWKN